MTKYKLEAIDDTVFVSFQGVGNLLAQPIGIEPVIVAFSNHSPFLLTASRDGFYEKVLDLQGKQNTWWTGATWNNHATADLWKCTEEAVDSLKVN